jgi:hypothetical protein
MNKQQQQKIKILILVITLLLLGSGCLQEPAPSEWVESGVVNYVKTLDINRHIQLSGLDAYGTPGTNETAFDLQFYHVGSTEVFGVRSGWFPDQYGDRAVVRFMDMGEVDYEKLVNVPENKTSLADYQPISTEVIYSTQSTAGNTLLKLNHVYALYRWNPQGGNYLKLFVQRIDAHVSRVQIRGTYQMRQGNTVVSPSTVPY